MIYNEPNVFIFIIFPLTKGLGFVNGFFLTKLLDKNGIKRYISILKYLFMKYALDEISLLLGTTKYYNYAFLKETVDWQKRVPG